MEGTLPVDERRAFRDRRRQRASFRFPERRLGFERRLPPTTSVRGTYLRVLDVYRKDSTLLTAVLAAIIGLNLADLLLTARALEMGASELNPFMATLFDADMVLAGLFKVIVGGVVVLGIWALRPYRRALELSLLALAGFSLLMVYHVVALVAAT
jgi:hypothetical protein